MTPEQFDLLVRRLVLAGTPKAPPSKVVGQDGQDVLSTSVYIYRGLHVRLRMHTCMPNVSLLHWATPQVVVFLIVLVWFMDLPALPPHELIEYFSGVARIATLGKWAGYRAAAVDMSYGEPYGRRTRKRSPMDINSNAGLLPLARLAACVPICAWYIYILYF